MFYSVAILKPRNSSLKIQFRCHSSSGMFANGLMYNACLAILQSGHPNDERNNAMTEKRRCSACTEQFVSYGASDQRTICGYCENEKQALALASDYVSLRKRLASARVCLRAEYRKTMRNTKYQFRKRRMLSQCGKYELVWQTRNQPNMPACYENQQTTQGHVVFNEIKRIVWTPQLN